MEQRISAAKMRHNISYLELLNVSSRDHHANSVFVNSRSLSPGTNNLIAMTKFKIDRTDFDKVNNDDFILRQQDFCGAESDRMENEFRRVKY